MKHVDDEGWDASRCRRLEDKCIFLLTITRFRRAFGNKWSPFALLFHPVSSVSPFRHDISPFLLIFRLFVNTPQSTHAHHTSSPLGRHGHSVLEDFQQKEAQTQPQVRAQARA